MLLDDEQQRPAAGGANGAGRLGRGRERAFGRVFGQAVFGHAADSSERAARARTTMTTSRLLAGASGYSFKEWKGSVLSRRRSSPRRCSRWYSAAAADGRDQQHVLPDAEDDACSNPGRARRPTRFRFAIKASRRITHIARLKAESAAEPLGYLYRNLAALGAKRGPVLFQLPPNLKKDLPRLTEFLALLPDGHRAAFEFRNDTLVRRRCLRRAQGRRRVAVPLRARGQRAAAARRDGAVGLRAAAARNVLGRRSAGMGGAARATSWREIHVYFMHEPTAPAYAQALMEFASG